MRILGVLDLPVGHFLYLRRGRADKSGMAVLVTKQSLLPMMREFRNLEKRRKSVGITPLEYQRWMDLKTGLEANLKVEGQAPDSGEQRKSSRIPTRLLVKFRSDGELQSAIIENVSHGGLFVATPFAPEIGVEFVLCIRVDNSGKAVDIPCVVVSNNVANDFSTRNLGMGVKFLNLSIAQQKAVDALLTTALTSDLDAEA